MPSFPAYFFSCSDKFTLKPYHLGGRYLQVFALCLFTLQGMSQKFPASAIPDSLKENANMVVRLEEIVWDIKSAGEATVKKHFVYTILNERGNEYSKYATLYSSKSISLNSVTGYLYDGSGKEINHFKKKDMEDHPYEDGVSFVNDERYKIGGFSYNKYPYTVEFEEETLRTGFIGFDNWMPQNSFMESVELSKYSVITPLNYEFKFKMLNSIIEPVMEEKGKKKTSTWQVRNLKAYEEMPFSATCVLYLPRLLISLGEINLDGFTGNMTSWNEFGKFYASLQKGRDVLPEVTIRKVHELTDGLSDSRSKVIVLYSYLQQNTHYVNVQLGIGGWQASDANYVATKKYGDCKALSNFMVSLLKEAGIKGHAVVIKGGEETMDFVTDFTNDPFNHVICCVPLETDTIWLECTDQFLPAGYLSKFTSNRYGLFIDDNGGCLVHTPAYLLKDNIQVRNITAMLDNNGNLNLDCKTSYKALCQDNIEGLIHHRSRDEQLSLLKSKFILPTYDVLSFNYKEDYSRRVPVINEYLRLEVKDYAQVTEKRIFINPNILSRSGEKYAEDKSRKLDVDLKEEYRLSDSVQILIPAGYEMESRSSNLELKSQFGRYLSRVVVSGDKITYYRMMEQFSGRFPSKEYAGVVKFYNDIYDADHSSIVLVKKN